MSENEEGGVGNPLAEITVIEAEQTVPAPAEDAVILQLGDLLPDASGEVVLFTGDDVPVNILTDTPLTGAGIAEPHVTETGLDVTGLHFYSFESGVTLYSVNDLLILDDTPTG